ncbi:hypothetical protein DNO_0057 [Dichelobacter nodosus VCS1703A]|uniref:Uncharacterized protein n=1 Tax=Dichelobacter nodosus (strain VCS1703A) TaxID=246195 RepID=A5EWV7_DICNV|nr:hypothetical protein DNO_0057 [Dichelobacter nodosus VCS1703A]
MFVLFIIGCAFFVLVDNYLHRINRAVTRQRHAINNIFRNSKTANNRIFCALIAA